MHRITTLFTRLKYKHSTHTRAAGAVVVVVVVIQIGDSLALEESYVEYGGVKVNKLENVHLGSEVVIIFCWCAMKFWRNKS